MSFFKRLGKAIHSKPATYIYYALAAAACVFINSSTWAYKWIIELYPLGAKFIPTVTGVLIASMVLLFVYLILLSAYKEKGRFKGKKAFDVIHTIIAVLSIGAFIYSLVLVFNLDAGFNTATIMRGLKAFAPRLPLLGVAILLPLPVCFCDSFKKAIQATVVSVVAAALIITPMQLIQNSDEAFGGDLKMPEIKLQSENLIKGATLTFESLKDGEKADAAALLDNSGKCWTPQEIDRMPADGTADANNSYVEIKLSGETTFNTAIIEEVGNNVQYFRLQAKDGDEWKTVYESEKIQAERLCSFDAVTTDSIRLSIDKFRSSDAPAKIKSISLFNEPKRSANDFEVTAYQRLDGDVPTEILAKGEAYVNNYAQFYDVYSTVLVFAATYWDSDGNMTFTGGEEHFAQELKALREVIDHRSNKEHKVKIIVTTLADGTWGEGHQSVNEYMTKYWEKVADQTVDFVDKYKVDGADIDWEYPANANDWQIFDKFIARIDEGMHKINPDAILSAALSSSALGMTEETLDRFDQIQFMAYDGNDDDGYQSSLEQAQEGLQLFKDNGADISKINIGIAAYGRPVNGSPFWASWRDLKEATYWQSKYFAVHDAGQVYEGTFCAPALAGDKTAYALFSGAGGVMVFRSGCDKTIDNPNSVACGIQNALNRYVTNW